MEPFWFAVLAGMSFGGVLVGLLAGYWGHNRLHSRAFKATEDALQQQIEQARNRSREILQESQKAAQQIRSEIEKDRKNAARQHNRDRKDLTQRQRKIDRSNEALQQRRSELDKRNNRLTRQEQELNDRVAAELERVSGLNRDDARQMLERRVEEEQAFEFKKRFRDAELQFQQDADERARELLAASMQRYASEVVAEASVTSIPIPSDELKGRLIGREGRNIRAIQATTGVDLIVDDAPESVTISCFDPVRREVARVALERLVKDGRIQPARIEDTVRRARREVDQAVRKAGEAAMFEVGVRGLRPEIVKLMGRLKFRYSYGENVLQHSIEVGQFAGLMAGQIGANVQLCKTAGFLHDIGKALTHEVDGPHAEIGADIAAQHGMRDDIVLAIREHHDREMTSVASFLVGAADAISAARPGARSDTNEAYLKRLAELEEVALGFDGVQRVFAIQAGREVRVMVDPNRIGDAEASSLSADIANSIEQRLQYPGLIKVVVIRESRAESVAK